MFFEFLNKNQIHRGSPNQKERDQHIQPRQQIQEREIYISVFFWYGYHFKLHRRLLHPYNHRRFFQWLDRQLIRYLDKRNDKAYDQSSQQKQPIPSMPNGISQHQTIKTIENGLYDQYFPDMDQHFTHDLR